ncbi:ATP-dependent zinc metalloprotease FtsH [Merdimmobilis hominis]|uniref:ATP-dependent zinc metalloprotease FtsH n=2 Tax=Oscillospiraceae TaxID=216572 RepID=A0A6N2R0L5_9FIRM
MHLKSNKNKGLGIYLAVLLALMLTLTAVFSQDTTPNLVKYSTILGYFEDQKVRDFELDYGTGDLSLVIEEDGKRRTVVSSVPNSLYFMDQIQDDIDKYNEANPGDKLTYQILPPVEAPWWVQMLPTLLLIGAMVVFWFMMMRQSRGSGGGNVMGFGKAKARTPDEGRKVTFADVAGADEEKAELVEIVEFLKNPAKFNSLGARIPKGVLLMGPPGTGKTLLARAVAGEAGVPFFSISGSDFVEMFVGVGASRVRDLFEQAKKNAPSIVFIDEIDAVGRQRGAGLGGGHDEREQTLNQLLVEMDGFGANSGVIIIAATNRRDILDPALLRPGRFDRQILVGYPDIKGREEILKVHTRNKPLAPDVNLKTIASTTAGFTGADLENLVNEAALLAARKDKKAITMQEIEDATIKVVAGPEKKSHVVTEKDKRLTAFHEAGHAVCTYYMPTQDPVHRVSIIPRGMAGGFTLSLPSQDRSYMTKTEMVEEIVVLLGGRVAEKLVLNEISTGASNDIERATKIARNMITRYGFSEKLGPIVYGQNEEEVFLGRDISHSRNYSETVAAEIDGEIREVIDTCYESTRQVLEDHMDQLHRVAEYLMTYEKVDGEKFKALMENREVPPSAEDTFVPLSKLAEQAKGSDEPEQVIGEEPPVEEYPADPSAPDAE